MRYSIFVYLNQMCETLEEASRYLQTCPSTDPSVPGLVSGSLEMLDAIGKAVEKEKDSVTNAELFRALELCKNTCIGYANGLGQIQAEEFSKTVLSFHDLFQSSVRYRIRAVFFAELGEKWDSLRSVYEAFCAREDCDPVVVLTPIFREVNQNGQKVRETIYQDYLTPMGVPFLEYGQYDIQKDAPDLAFTCQPYESCTLPQFWANNIAKWTRLVYVPYFAPHMLYAESKDVLCHMPIYHFAWRTIGSGEKHEQYYRANSSNQGKNMLVTGIPKWDETVGLKKNGLPEEKRAPDWEEKIEGKKVFLWNTFYDISTSSLRYWDEVQKYLEKNPDCLLIWRPHPMTKSVTKLYRSGEAYQKLLQRYDEAEQSGQIIVDHQVSYQPAFFYSDALLSDFSSMMCQYLLLDKPVLWMFHPSWKPTTALISNRWMEKAENISEVFAFFDRIKQGIDCNRALREQVRNQDIPLADGNCGYRVAESVIREMKREDRVR